MDKINTTPLSGTQELLPELQASFNQLKSKINQIYRQHGFFNIETPCLERSEILLAKAGGDTEKQIYHVIKTGEKFLQNPTQALRFDHTVPLARYVVEHGQELIFPFKTAQIGLNFRGERAQKGRFHEFYQCDIDVIGRGSLSLSYDADVISTLLDAFQSFKLNTPVLARINNRKILSGFLEFLDLSEKSVKIYNIIDHAEKVTPAKTKLDLENLDISSSAVQKILSFIEINGNRSSVIKKLNNLEIKNETFETGVTELDQVLYLLEAMDLKEQISADMKIVRGLDYYTGTVFEFILPEHKNIGSVCGGGRYDNLTKHFSKQTFPGVGGSIGLTRLFFVLNEHQLLSAQSSFLLDYAIIPVSDAEIEYSLKTAQKLRSKNYNVSVVFLDKKLSDKISYATKIAKNGIVIGESEIADHILKAKDFTTGETSILNLDISSTPADFWAD